MRRRALPLLPARAALMAAAVLAALAAGCGEQERPAPAPARALPPQDLRPVPIGRGPRFRPAAAPRDGRPVAGLRCGGPARRFGVHLELFAAGRVVVVPAGIGVPPPFVREGAFVRAGGCRYAVSTTEPTGVLEVVHGTRASLGDLFELWGARLSPYALAGFRGRVRAFVDGRRVRTDPRAIALRHHAQVVLAVGPDVPVHSAFGFRAGL